jgi:Fe2+ transport system protein B
MVWFLRQIFSQTQSFQDMYTFMFLQMLIWGCQENYGTLCREYGSFEMVASKRVYMDNVFGRFIYKGNE